MNQKDQTEWNLVEREEGPEARPPDIIGAVGGVWRRIKAGFGGLMFTVVALVFMAVGVGMTVKSAYQAMTYRQVQATVTQIQGGGDSDDCVSITYRYQVDGRDFEGQANSDDDDSDYSEMSRLSVGQEIAIWYDPSEPDESLRSVRASAEPLGFALFALPFLVLGMNQVSATFRGKPLWATKRVGTGDPIPGGWRFLVLVGLCCVGTFALILAASVLPFALGLGIFLVYGFAVIPLVMWWTGRIARRRPKARKSLRKRVGPVSALPHLGKQFAMTAGFTAFWCGITGVFIFFAVVRPMMQVSKAAGWDSTEGVVLLSKVKVQSGSDSTTYKPVVRYRYMVNGDKHIGERYDFMDASSSDSDYANRVVREHPAGSKVTVSYAPDDPTQSVLSKTIPPLTYFLMVFLQPFALVGVGMLAYTLTLPHRHAGLRRFMSGSVAMPWRIPTWGVMQQGMHGLTIRRRGFGLVKILYVFALGYGLTSFVSIFVLAFLVGMNAANPTTLRIVVYVGLGVGGAAVVRSLVAAGRGAVVTIDQARRTLNVQSRKRQEQVGLDEIRSWRIRQIRYAGGITVNNRRNRYLLLEILATDGRTVPVHAFSFSGSMLTAKSLEPVVRRTQAGFAELTAGRCRKTIIRKSNDSEDIVAEPNNPIQAIHAFGKVIRAWRRKKNYSDLA